MDQTSHLLQLPAELRCQIYRMVVLEPRIINVTGRCHPTEPALLAANHQIRREALQIYYRENGFLVQISNPNAPAETVSTWFNSISPARASVLSRLWLQYVGRSKELAGEIPDELRGPQEEISKVTWNYLVRPHLASIVAAGVRLEALMFAFPTKLQTLEDLNRRHYCEAAERVKNEMLAKQREK